MNRTERAIDKIMSEAFLNAAVLLEREIVKLFRVYPGRYSRFILAVGWGPTLFDSSGNVVKSHTLPRKGRDIMALADRFYDRYGADNREVCARGTALLSADQENGS